MCVCVCIYIYIHTYIKHWFTGYQIVKMQLHLLLDDEKKVLGWLSFLRTYYFTFRCFFRQTFHSFLSARFSGTFIHQLIDIWSNIAAFLVLLKHVLRFNLHRISFFFVLRETFILLESLWKRVVPRIKYYMILLLSCAI